MREMEDNSLVYLARYKAAICKRFKAGMSIRRLAEIYGGSAQDIEKILSPVKRTEPKMGVFAHDFSGKDALTSKATRLFDALPPKVQKICFEAASECGVPTIALFQDMGKKTTEKKARGWFFHAIATRCGWSYRQISIHSGWSRSYVISAISRYLDLNGET